MDAGEVTVKLTADTSSIEGAFARARQDLTNLANHVKGSSETAGTSLFGMGAAAVAVGGILEDLAQQAFSAGKAILSFPLEAARAAGRAAEQFDQLAQRTGIAVDALQGLQVAMAREGLEAGSLALGFRTLSGHIVGMAEGTAKSAELFRQLGISAQTVSQGTGALMSAIADRFAGMADGAEKSRFAVELFGRSGLQLIPILNQGSAGLDAAMRKAAEFGLILTKTQQKDLKVFDDSLDDLGSALKGFTAQVGAAFAPSLTALVKGMTAAVVFAKDVFNLFADAGEKLTIRLGAMAAALSVMAQQLFSFSIFSKEAWKQTLEQVNAIDAWAAAQIKGVDASRKQEKTLGDLASAHLKTSDAVKTHTDHQKILGEQAVAFTTIKLSLQAEANRKYFQELMDLQEQASKSNYLAGPEPGIGSDAAQQLAGRNAIANAQLVRQITKEAGDQQLADDKMRADATMALQNATYQNQLGIFSDTATVRNAATGQILADLNIQKQAEQQALNDGKLTQTQYQDHIVNLEQQATTKRMAIVRQYPTFFEQQMQSLVQSNAFSIGQITSSWTSGLANAMVNGGNFVKQAWKSTQVAIIQAALNTGIQLAAQWALDTARRVAMQTTESALIINMKLATNAATLASDQATAFLSVATWTAASASVKAALLATSTSVITALLAVWTFTKAVLGAIAAAMKSTIFGIPVGLMITAALVVGSILVMSASKAAGIALAAAAVGTAALTLIPFAAGGIVTRPTPALVGESGPEAIIPLSQLGGMGGSTTIIIEMDGREMTRRVLHHMPREVRLATGLT